jgi:hypothetical protein
MLCELATLSCPLLALGKAAEGAAAWVHDSQAKGQLLWMLADRNGDAGPPACAARLRGTRGHGCGTSPCAPKR